MIALGATITDSASPAVRDILDRVTPNRIAAEIGPRLTRLVARNFLKLPKNKQGFPTTNFWARAAKSTNWQAGSGYVDVVVNQIGIRQRLLGGVIKPVHAKMLTFPAVAEAYGRTAGEFENLKFAFALDPTTGRMRPALVEKAGIATVKKGRKKKDGTQTETVTGMSTGLVALFWLARKANQSPNPAVMPSDDEFTAELDKSVDVLLRNPVARE